VVQESRNPALDGAFRDAEEVGDLVGRVSIEVSLYGQAPPMLQFRG
jgi:hypothetical protein